ncbi:MAG TPA: type II secretion system F family protein [Desulfosporosinus sp.]|nr:type II secretion system F family protein [Desulfosporosinus sp.]
MKAQRFVWKAVDTNGIIQHGVWVGNEISDIQGRLKNEGYFPVAIRTRRDWKSVCLPARKKFQWSHFARRLATLLEAGIPLLQALEIMTFHQEKSTDQLEQWKTIKGRVEEGSDLSEAMSLLNPPPNSFVLSMIKAGEYTGTLGKVLSEVADETDQDFGYQKKIKAALAYPLFLLFAVVIVLYVLSVYVLPMYEKLFMGMGTELPMLTQVIFVCGRKIPVLLWSGLVLIVVGLLVLRLTSPDLWKTRLRHLLGRLPLSAKVYRLRDLVQFTRMLGRLLAAGIPLLEALRLTTGALRGREMLELMNQLVLHVRQGKRMAPLLRASKVFPKEGAEMIAVAEETGQLDRMLHYVTYMFRSELEDYLNRLTRMIEPALILAIAGLIGIVAAGVMLPMFDLSTHLE